MSDLVGHPNCWFSHAQAHFQMTKIEIGDAMMQFSDEELESQRMLMWHCFSTYITPSIQSVVEFAKRVPGMFNEPPNPRAMVSSA